MSDSKTQPGLGDRFAILEILRSADIDPDKMVGDQTAYEVLEAAIMGALDTIEAA